ncbi:phosphoketolase family protein [Sinomonas humi]|uniref:hypothetical protein n=1 Tax=Sinomonas humi TaxID=1338436 RepID=UPI0038B4B14A
MGRYASSRPGTIGEDPLEAHARFAAVLDEALDHIAHLKTDAAVGRLSERRAWPMILFARRRAGRTPRRSTATRRRATSVRIRSR